MIQPPPALATLLAALLSIVLTTPSDAQPRSTSLSLGEALATALDRNPDLAAAEAHQGVAGARAKEARSRYLPQIHLSGAYSRYDEPNIVVPIHEAGVFPPLDDDIYEGVGHVTMPLFNGGRTGSAYRAAKATIHESRAQTEATAAGVLRGVAQVFIRAEELSDRKSLLEARLSALGERRRELELLLDEGRAAPGDLAQITAAIERVRSDSLEVELARSAAATQLGQLVGGGDPVHPAPNLDRDDRGSLEGFAPGNRGEEASGPAVRMREAQLDGAKARQAEASRAFWPEVSAFASYALRSGGDLDATGEWVAGVGLALPLFDGGRRLAARRAAMSAVDVAQEQLRAEQQSQIALLEIASDQWRAAGARRTHLATAIGAQSVSVSTHQRMYEEGRVALSDLLTQEAELLELQIVERAAISTARLAVLDYHAALGTLTPALAEDIVRSSQ